MDKKQLDDLFEKDVLNQLGDLISKYSPVWKSFITGWVGGAVFVLKVDMTSDELKQFIDEKTEQVQETMRDMLQVAGENLQRRFSTEVISDQASLGQLQTLLGYEMWKDGAPWHFVQEILYGQSVWDSQTAIKRALMDLGYTVIL